MLIIKPSDVLYSIYPNTHVGSCCSAVTDAVEERRCHLFQKSDSLKRSMRGSAILLQDKDT